MQFVSELLRPPYTRSAAVVPFNEVDLTLDERGAVFHLDGGIDNAPNWCWFVNEQLKSGEL